MIEPKQPIPEIPAGFSALLKLEGGEANRHEARAEPFDLSPLVISALETLPVKFLQPLVLTPFLDDERQPYLCAAEPRLCLDAFALNREQLLNEVQEQLTMLWQEYALADDAALDDEAQRLRATLKTLMTDSNNLPQLL